MNDQLARRSLASAGFRCATKLVWATPEGRRSNTDSPSDECPFVLNATLDPFRHFSTGETEGRVVARGSSADAAASNTKLLEFIARLSRLLIIRIPQPVKLRKAASILLKGN